MLAGVIHDLRTVLTRFKLELALLGDTPETEAHQEGRRRDGRDARGLSRLRARRYRRAVGADRHRARSSTSSRPIAERHGHRASVAFHGQPIVTVRPAAFKRCLANLVSNAARFAATVAIAGHRDHRWLTVTVDDDGPGIPRRCARMCSSRSCGSTRRATQDEGGTGLGLAIARDIARSHGGDITLGDSPLGGLRATVKVPV